MFKDQEQANIESNNLYKVQQMQDINFQNQFCKPLCIQQKYLNESDKSQLNIHDISQNPNFNCSKTGMAEMQISILSHDRNVKCPQYFCPCIQNQDNHFFDNNQLFNIIVNTQQENKNEIKFSSIFENQQYQKQGHVLTQFNENLSENQANITSITELDGVYQNNKNNFNPQSIPQIQDFQPFKFKQSLNCGQQLVNPNQSDDEEGNASDIENPCLPYNQYPLISQQMQINKPKNLFLSQQQNYYGQHLNKHNLFEHSLKEPTYNSYFQLKQEMHQTQITQLKGFQDQLQYPIINQEFQNNKCLNLYSEQKIINQKQFIENHMQLQNDLNQIDVIESPKINSQTQHNESKQSSEESSSFKTEIQGQNIKSPEKNDQIQNLENNGLISPMKSENKENDSFQEKLKTLSDNIDYYNSVEKNNNSDKLDKQNIILRRKFEQSNGVIISDQKQKSQKQLFDEFSDVLCKINQIDQNQVDEPLPDKNYNIFETFQSNFVLKKNEVVDHQRFIENLNKKSELQFKDEIELFNKQSKEIMGYARDHQSNMNYHSYYYQGQIKPKINEIIFKSNKQIDCIFSFSTCKSNDISDFQKSSKNLIQDQKMDKSECKNELLNSEAMNDLQNESKSPQQDLLQVIRDDQINDQQQSKNNIEQAQQFNHQFQRINTSNIQSFQSGFKDCQQQSECTKNKLQPRFNDNKMKANGSKDFNIDLNELYYNFE